MSFDGVSPKFASLDGAKSSAIIDKSISRLAVDRYRSRVYVYIRDYLDNAFRTFAKESASVIHVTFGSTPMRVFRTDQRAGCMEVYGRTLEAIGPCGSTQSTFPELSYPNNSKTSGILATLPVKQMYIEDFAGSKPGFRVLYISCDGLNTNRSALRLLFTELQRWDTLLCIPHICMAHTINNATIWGLGCYAYGSILRLAHGIESVKHWGVAKHVKNMVLGPPTMDPILDTASVPISDYDTQIGSKLWHHRKAVTYKVWREYLKLICGQKGPFAKDGPRNKVDKLASMCIKLWPNGPPSRQEQWTCPADMTEKDIVFTLDGVFGRTVPLPISSRWYALVYIPSRRDINRFYSRAEQLVLSRVG